MNTETLNKGKRVDGAGFNTGRKYTRQGKVYISMEFKYNKMPNARNYHYCDLVIPDSVTKSTSLYDYNSKVIYVFDILEYRVTGEKYFVYKSNENSAFCVPLSLLEQSYEKLSDVSVSELLNIFKEKRIRVGKQLNYNSSKFIIKGSIYDDYPIIFMKLKQKTMS